MGKTQTMVPRRTKQTLEKSSLMQRNRQEIPRQSWYGPVQTPRTLSFVDPPRLPPIPAFLETFHPNYRGTADIGDVMAVAPTSSVFATAANGTYSGD